MREFAKSFYKSKAWKECRKSYITSVHGLCERCGSPGKIVHHKKTLNPKNINDVNITLNHSNLEYLCQDCHNKEHIGGRGAIEKGLRFDKEGNLIQLVRKDG